MILFWLFSIYLFGVLLIQFLLVYWINQTDMTVLPKKEGILWYTGSFVLRHFDLFNLSNCSDSLSPLDQKRSNTQCFKNHRKHCERSELSLHFEWTKSWLKVPKNGLFWQIFENLKLVFNAFNSVTRQVYLNMTKIGEKCQYLKT